MIVAGKEDDEALLTLALEHGVDVSSGADPDTVVLDNAPRALSDLGDLLSGKGYEIVQADHMWVAETKVPLDENGYEKYETLHDVLLELDDVQSVFTNATHSHH